MAHIDGDGSTPRKTTPADAAHERALPEKRSGPSACLRDASRVGAIRPWAHPAGSAKGWKVNVDNLGVLFLSELVGTAMLVLLGCGVVANVALAKTKGFGGGFIGAQMIGAIIGAVIVWLAYKQHFDEEPDPAPKLGTFSTGPGIRNYAWNLITEIIGTFVLVFVVIGFGRQGDPSGLAALGALPVALLVVGIGVSLGGPTGYAINPARDLGPRIAHAFLPIRGKGASDWAYSWVPVVGPIIGGLLAGWAAIPLLPIEF
jgi:glycerol uptake facilitator protein